MKNSWNSEELFLTREMIKDICDMNLYSINHNAQKGLSFSVCDNLNEIIRKNVENGNLSYHYEDNPNILIVENNETRMTEVYSSEMLKIVCGEKKNEGLFENVLLTRLCLANLDLTQVNSMRYWFSGAKIDIVDFSKVKTPNLLDMKGMFSGTEVKQIIWGDIFTPYVRDMSSMFSSCVVDELLLSPILTTRVEDMSEMFADCWAKKIDCSNFDTRNVRNMESMFLNARVDVLDLSGWDTSKVTNMDLMFSDCDVRKLNIKNFSMLNVKLYRDMFLGCDAKVIAKDEAIKAVYKEDTEKEIADFDYRDIDDILNAKLENLDVDMFIIEKIMGCTRCELIIHLWGLSANELCFQVGLNKQEVEEVLHEMEKIANIIETRYKSLMYHIKRCRKKLS